MGRRGVERGVGVDDREVDRLLDLALARPAAERATFLDRECGDDRAAREQLNALLLGYEGAATFDIPVLEILRPGVTIADRYTIERQLGAGGFGAVWLCRDDHGQHCAIKIPRRDSLERPGVVDAFKREAFRWIRLGDHPHIVYAYGMVDVLRLPAVVMEYVANGVSLDKAMRSTRFDWRTAVLFGVQIAAGMAYAHERVGLIHNDLKPGNLLVLPGGQLKIIDFGIAIAHALESPSSESRLGSMPYMPPERWLAIPPDTRSDVYSVGIVLFEVIAGRRPFTDHSDVEQYRHDHLSTPVPDLRTVCSDVPATLAALVAACLAKEPERRPQGFRSLGRELERVATSLGVSTVSMATGDARRPNTAEGSANLAITFHGLNRLREAEEAACDAVEADPTYIPGWHALGNVMLSAKRWPDAIRAFVKVQQLDPADVVAVQGLVSAFCGGGSLREALAWMTQAFARAHHTNMIEMLENLPESLLRELDQPVAALRLCEAVLERNAMSIRSWNSRAIALRRLGDYDAALSSVDRAIELNSAYAPAWTNRATILAHLYRWDDAIHSADRALSLDETIANAYLAKALALRAQGLVDVACACLRHGLEFRPDNRVLIHALGSQMEAR
jgi:tetratricopeptide (TPR) repeat protein